MLNPDVAVFDGHAVLGKRPDDQFDLNHPKDLLESMDKIGIERALVYHRDAVAEDTIRGNDQMMSLVDGHPRLVPQHIVNMAADNLDHFTEDECVRAVRAFPKSHGYSFSTDVVEAWFRWLEATGIALWISADEVEIRDLFQCAKAFPTVDLVLSGMQNRHFAAVWAIIQRLPNLYIELSRLDNSSGVRMMIERTGASRLIFGSYYPDLDPAAYLAYLYQCRIPDDELQAICHGNLSRLLERTNSGVKS